MTDTQITTLDQFTKLKLGLTALAKRAALCTNPDKEIMKELQQSRKFIVEAGKYLRDDYNRLAKEVIAQEKELLAIIAVEEERLKRLKEEEEAEKERLYRVSRFKERNGRIGSLGTDAWLSYTYEINNTLSDADFEKFYQSCITSINEKKQAELEERERKIHEEEERLARIKRDEEWAEKIRKEESEKAARAIKDAEERAKRAEQDAKEKAERDERERIANKEAEKLAKEQKEADEKKKLDADIAYNMWLESMGYTEETKTNFVVEKYGNKVRLSRILGIYTIE